MQVPCQKRCSYQSRTYKIYVLLLLTFCYLLNFLDRYVLMVTAKPMANEIHFGNRKCHCPNTSNTKSLLTEWRVQTSTERCSVPGGNSSDCFWQYSGTGVEYELLAGPMFIIVFGVTGVVISLASDSLPNLRRKIMLFVCILMWSAMVGLSGFTKTFWQLALTRFGLGIFEGGCTPFSTSLISDIFSPQSLGAAMSVYNWGIYTGFGSSFLFNFVRDACGWRWVYYSVGIAGFLVGFLILMTMQEPEKDHRKSLQRPSARTICKTFLNVRYIIVSVGGALRNGAGLTWAYHVQIFFAEYSPGVEVAYYMSWIPVVAGPFGALMGGVLSDRLTRKYHGNRARLWVLILCQVAALPFLIGTLYLQPPWAFMIFIPGYAIGDMWIGASFAVVIEMVHPTLRTTSVAGYLLIMNVVGGNINVLVAPLTKAIGLRNTILLLYPGMYFASAILFFITLCLSHSQSNRTSIQINSETEPLLRRTNKECKI